LQVDRRQRLTQILTVFFWLLQNLGEPSEQFLFLLTQDDEANIYGETPLRIENVVDEIVFVVPRNWIGDIEKYILYCEAVGVPATLATDFFDLEIARGVPKQMEEFKRI